MMLKIKFDYLVWLGLKYLRINQYAVSDGSSLVSDLTYCDYQKYKMNSHLSVQTWMNHQAF